MGFLRTILILILVYYVLKWLGRILFPVLFQKAVRNFEDKMREQQGQAQTTDQVKEGETVKFVITNAGELVHEFNIGTPDAHHAHAPEMQMMVDHGILEADKINWEAAKKMQKEMGHGMHEEPNSALLEPGKTAEIVWQFPDHADIEFACNVPGHYDAGMAGEIELTH